MEFYELLGELVGDIVIQSYALKAAGKIAKAAELVANATQRVAKGERILEGFGPIGRDIAQVVGLSAEHGNEVVQEAIKVTLQEKDLIKEGQLFFQEVEKNAVKKISKLTIDLSRNDIPHIFRNEPGHLLDTAINRKLLIETANNIENFLGVDQYGTNWYAKILPNEKQVWVAARNNLIRNGGVNETPKIFNSKTGLARNL